MKTIKLYDDDAYAVEFAGKVLSCEQIEEGYAVILDKTLFFPEEGGQTPDKGDIDGIEVLDVQIKDNIITHTTAQPLEVGKMVQGKIDWQHRFYNMQQHSGEHLFSGLAYRKYGYKNVGFHLSNQIVTMDFDGVFTKEQLDEMEWEINKAIVANVPIKTGYPSKEELAALDYRSKLALEEDVRIVEIEGYDICACCAPHVHRTGEIGSFKIQSAQNYKKGMRISILCGFRALVEYQKKSEIIAGLTSILTTNQELLIDNVKKQKAQIQTLSQELNIAKQALMEYKLQAIPSEKEHVLLFEQGLEQLVMRNIVNQLVEKHSGICAVFVGDDTRGYSYILGSKNIDCREIASRLREAFGAKGGGTAPMIQGQVLSTQEAIRNLLEK